MKVRNASITVLLLSCGILSTVCGLLSTSLAFASLRGKVNQGNRFYKEGNYPKALERYRDAQIDYPEMDRLHLNVGSALYKMKRYRQAIEEYEKVVYSKAPLFQAKAYYNIGNCLYRLGKLKDSIFYYKKALELNPKDSDAKYNIEFVQRKLKELMDKQKKEGQKGKIREGKEKDKQSPSKVREANNRERKGMSKEDAKRILDAFKEEKRRRIMIMGKPESEDVEKDW
ncbi:MAG: tetratricopeptide repeat protein [bacterium]|nr:tetratricopeptide repeat protein [bacterium]